jgi:hypothetical protein
MGLLYGRAGRLTAQNGGFRPGQWKKSPAVTGWQTTGHALIGRAIMFFHDDEVRGRLEIRRACEIIGPQISRAPKRLLIRMQTCQVLMKRDETETVCEVYTTKGKRGKDWTPAQIAKTLGVDLTRLLTVRAAPGGG